MPDLHDGSVVASDSEAWRHECEAAFVLAMTTIEERRRYLSAVEKRRSTAARERLQATILAIRNVNAKP